MGFGVMPAAYPTPASLTPPFAFSAARPQRVVTSDADSGPAARAFGECCLPVEIAAARGGPAIRMFPGGAAPGAIPTAVERTASRPDNGLDGLVGSGHGGSGRQGSSATRGCAGMRDHLNESAFGLMTEQEWWTGVK